MNKKMIEVNALKGKEVERRVELDGGTEWCGCDCNRMGGQLCHQRIMEKMLEIDWNSCTNLKQVEVAYYS